MATWRAMAQFVDDGDGSNFVKGTALPYQAVSQRYRCFDMLRGNVVINYAGQV